MWLDLDGRGGLQEQLARAVRAQILSGRLPPGTRLPSSRSLARDTGRARNTVVLAFRQLQDEGFLETRHGAGTFVAESLPEPLLAETLLPEALPPERSPAPSTAPGRARIRGASGSPEALRLSRAGDRLKAAAPPGGLTFAATRPRLPYDFRYGEPGTLDLPWESWCRTLSRRARRASRAELSYGPPGGAPELREALAAYLARARGVVCRPEQILVVQGSQQAVDLVARLLVDPGDRVVLEEAHYPGFRMALAAAGAEIATAAVDDEGLRPDSLPGASERDAAPGHAAGDTPRGVFVTPSHQFPTGGVMPLGRRLALLEWARRHGAFVLEDDYDAEFRYDGRPLATLQGLDGGERVLTTGTFSKALFPALRIGYLVVPEALVDAFLGAQAATTTGTGGLEQRALADFLRDGSFERHLRRARRGNARRREALLAALDRYLGERVRVVGANAGLHLLGWLPGMREAEATALRRRAADAGVGLYPVHPFYLRRPRIPGLLLGYAALEPEEIDEGIRRLAAVMR